MDPLVRFEIYEREVFLNREHVLSIFSTLKKHMKPLENVEL